MDDAWYQKRDARTDACNNVSMDYKQAIVQVCVTETQGKAHIQFMTHVSLLMLARWCRHIVITMDDAQCLIGNCRGSFTAFLSQALHEVDPYLDLVFSQNPADDRYITLYIGVARKDWAGSFVSINAEGWLAYCAFNQMKELPVTNGHDHLIGAGFAACLGNAEIFRFVTGQPSRPYTKCYSLWSNEVSEGCTAQGQGPSEQNCDIGRVHLIGCGAIGSSFIYLQPFMNIAGKFLLVDPDNVEIHNTSSSLLFVPKHAEAEMPKVDICKSYLLSIGVAAETLQDEYSNFNYYHADKGLAAADVILCFANEHNIWSTIQHQYPPVCFHATTSKSWGVHVGRHIPLVENCLMCTFQDVIKAEFKPACAHVNLPHSQATVDEPTESHTAILPFLAPAAALITLAEIIKMAAQKHSHENTTIFNLGTSDGDFVTDYESFGKCFICSIQERLYPRLGNQAKFWALSVKK